MPKVYSDQEREEIKRKLHIAANELLVTKGVRKTTVDELVLRVGIPKGTFYLFYVSKELLLFEVIKEYHEQIEREMMTKCVSAGSQMNLDMLTNIITEGILAVEHSCLRTLMNPEEMELLIRKLPKDIVESHLEHDDDLLGDMLKLLPIDHEKLRTLNLQAFSGAFRAIFFSCLYQNEIGAEQFRDSITLLIKGLLMQIL